MIKVQRQLTMSLRCELVKLIRIPAFLYPSLIFPSLLFACFALPFSDAKIANVAADRYLFASFATYAATSIAMFGFGVAIASERAYGWLRLLKVTPVAATHYLAAKIIASGLFVAVSLTLLYGVAALTSHASPPVPRFLALTAALIVGMAPFVAIGMWLGLVVKIQAVGTVANLIYFPMMFVSGLFIPLASLPGELQAAAHFLPGFHLGAVAWSTVGATTVGSFFDHAAWLLAYTTVFVVLSAKAMRTDMQKDPL